MEKPPLQEKNAPSDLVLSRLINSYRLQEAIINNTELSIISADTSGIITGFNRAAETMLGYSAKEMIGLQTPAIFHDRVEIIKRAQELTIELGVPIEPGFDSFVAKARIKKIADRNEWTYVRKDGSRFPVLLSIVALLDEQEDIIGYVGIAADITEKRKSEDELLRIADENERMFNNTIDLNAIAGFDGYFKKLNRAWEKTLGWTREELMAVPYVNFVHPDDIERTQTTAENEAKKGDVMSFENRYRCKDGSYKWLLWTSTSDKNQQIIYASAVDITERKLTDQKIEESETHLQALITSLEFAVAEINEEGP
ncbi:MAG: PAS domain S-box protein, partial [Flammeovirgaceae bacterium]|nr:PAS domain S-box protein [Flammeovirgaceae bacterium]